MPSMVKYSTFYAAALAIAGTTEGFAPISSSRKAGTATTLPSPEAILQQHQRALAPSANLQIQSHDTSCALQQHTTTTLQMSSNNDNEGPAPITAIFISLVLLFFVVSAFAPLLDFASIQPSNQDLNLGDAVVTRQDDTNKLKNYQSKFDALSSTRIQQKLANLPVFYIAQDGGMQENIYFSYSEATKAASGEGSVVKVTTLDQIMYPLILKREGMFKPTAATPIEVKNAIASSSSTTYKLVPSAAAVTDAKDTGTTLKEGDIPLFSIARLAFAGSGGQPQVPLFLERADGVTSYTRLGKSDEAVVRTTSLLDVLDSMERGTRPAVGQLEFYGNAEDVLKADEMSSSQ
ncbi:hypothetical protein QTG54_010358 [Skeletonema marinoi]|uniref:Uncharacterized protein n=1 Tax=Skeletonema marinoi TaxID=267567 RepID=A0AAD8Y4S4_9STRA|nr:hypothetical protein QTG54_010358 [Skeletonema marinoi]